MASLLRRLSNPFHNWDYSQTHRSTDLSAQMKDDLFTWQLGAVSKFCALGADSLVRADITDSKPLATRILRRCHKLGIIDAATGQPDTYKITQDMVGTLAIISMPKQRVLVMVLFFWEEEITRWRLLGEEEREIKERLAAEVGDGERVGLEHALRVLDVKKRLLPSMRDESGQILAGGGGGDELPTYEEARRLGSS